MLAQPIGEHFGIQGEKCANVGTLISDDNDVRDERVCRKSVFEDLWGDVLTARSDDQFLLTTGNGELTVTRDRADIACVEPASIGHDCLSFFGKVIVTGHNCLASDKDFAVLGNFDEITRKGKANGSNRVCSQMLNCDRTGCF